MGRTSYTLSEIIFGMRSELLGVQDSLTSLKKYTTCEEKKIRDYYFELDHSYELEPLLECVFLKKRNIIQRGIDNYKDKHNMPIYNYEIGLCDIGGNNPVAVSKNFKLKIKPDETTSFNDECRRITDSKYVKCFCGPMLPMIGNVEEAKIEFDLKGIITTTAIMRHKYNAAIVVSYEALRDLITVTPMITSCDNDSINNILNLRVARCMLPYYHQDVIEKNIDDAKPLVISGEIKGNTKLTINEDNNRLVLKPKK